MEIVYNIRSSTMRKPAPLYRGMFVVRCIRYLEQRNRGWR